MSDLANITATSSLSSSDLNYQAATDSNLNVENEGASGGHTLQIVSEGQRPTASAIHHSIGSINEAHFDDYAIQNITPQVPNNEGISSAVESPGGSLNIQSSEALDQISNAISSYADRTIANYSPTQLSNLRRQIRDAGLIVGGGVALTELADHMSDPSLNNALTSLITTISSSLPHTAAVPLMGSAGPVAATHLAASSAILGTTTAALSSASTEAVINAAAAIVPFIVVGAIAHRLYVATSRIARNSSAIEHEVNNITTAMIATAFSTIPPAQHGLLLSAIIAGIIGQHAIDPGLIEKACHNLRDAALGVYLVKHPEVTIAIAEHVKAALVASVKEAYTVASTAGTIKGASTVTAATVTGKASSGIIATSAGVTASSTTTTSVTTGTSSTATAITTSGSHAATSHGVLATAAHGLTAIKTVAITTIAAHPGVATALLVGGACTAAWYYVSTNSNNTTPSTSSETTEQNK